jgi:hypothetical protein
MVVPEISSLEYSMNRRTRNAAQFEKIGPCRKITLRGDLRLEVVFDDKGVSPDWLRRLSVSAVASTDGKHVYHAPVESARRDGEAVVLVTYPTTQAEAETDPSVTLLPSDRWSGYLVSTTGNLPFRAPSSS